MFKVKENFTYNLFFMYCLLLVFLGQQWNTLYLIKVDNGILCI